MLERDDFRKRYVEQRPISIHESSTRSSRVRFRGAAGGRGVRGRPEVQFAGGRDLQRAYGQEPQVVMTTPLLVAGRRQQDEQEPRKLRGDHEPRDDLREDDVDLGRVDGHVLRAALRRRRANWPR